MFSKYSTYRYRSSKSQAKQIYSLNRRISKLEYKTKPEYVTKKTTILSFTLSSGSTSVDSTIRPVLSPAEMKSFFKGRLARMSSYRIVGSIHGSYQLVYPALVRIIILCTKAIQTGNPVITDIIDQGTSYKNPAYQMLGSLKPGITAQYRILSNKVYRISQPQSREREFVINIKQAPHLRHNIPIENMEVADSDALQIWPKGSVFMLITIANTGFQQSSEVAYPEIQITNMSQRCIFVDQN